MKSLVLIQTPYDFLFFHRTKKEEFLKTNLYSVTKNRVNKDAKAP